MGNPALQQLSVLYVEDEDDARSSLMAYLSRRIPNIITAENGESGLALFKSHRPALIITDINMPEMNGLAMCQAIRDIDPSVSIIITSAHTESNLLLTSIDMGVTKYVVKPINPNQLIEVIITIAEQLAKKKTQETYSEKMHHQLISDTHEHEKIERYLNQHMQSHLADHHAYLRHLNLSRNTISSTFFYAAKHKETRYLLLADTAGSGLSAVIPSLQVPRLFMDHASRGLSLSAIAEKLNAALFNLSFPDHFIAATLIRIDNDAHAIDVLNCGNPPILLMNEQGKELREFASNTLALGIALNTVFTAQVQHVTFSQNAFLYAFNKGLMHTLFPTDTTSAATHQDHTLLKKHFVNNHPQQVFNTLVTLIEATTPQHRADDVALVEMKLTATPPKPRVYH